MARDMTMLQAAEGGHATVRFYTWDRSWISLGYFQIPARDRAVVVALSIPPAELPIDSGIASGACSRHNVGIVVRPTGGKAVLHGHDLTVSVACPLALFEENRMRLRPIYRTLAQHLVEGLRRAGVSAELGDNRDLQQAPSADCFRSVSPNDIVHSATGAKVVGCAMRVTRDAVLMQCSIPIRPPAVPPYELFGPASEPTRARIEPGQLIAAIASQFSE